MEIIIKIFTAFADREKLFTIKAAGSLLAIIGIFLWPQTGYFSDITAPMIIELTNEERELTGQPPLSPNPLLTAAALAKAEAIFAAQSFAHDIEERKFSAWIRDAGYKYLYAGENLAVNFATSRGVMNAWKKSPTHWQNVTSSNFSEIGVAVMDGYLEGRRSTLVVQIFGYPRLTAVAADKGYAPRAIDYDPSPAAAPQYKIALTKDGNLIRPAEAADSGMRIQTEPFSPAGKNVLSASLPLNQGFSRLNLLSMNATPAYLSVLLSLFVFTSYLYALSRAFRPLAPKRT